MKRLFFSIFLFTAFFAYLPQPADAACITDDTGEEVCLDAPPARVISTYGAFTETIWELGGGKTLVARTKNDTTIPEVAMLPAVGTGLRPNIEYLLALAPDLVIARASNAGAETLASLRERGIETAAFDPASVDGVYSLIERLGVLFGLEARGGEIVEKIRGEIAAVEARVSKRESTPTLIYEVRAEPLTVAGHDSLVAELVKIAGGELMVDVDKKLVRFDVEKLLSINPDLYVVQEGPMNVKPLPPLERTHHPALKAVREGKVLTVDEKLISRPGPRIGEAVEVLSRFIHPELWQ
ncbi:MAG: iron ABC transporter substrate-binding protein [Deltaproteobacteria bacterium]|nr:MAG: iron ABC transporter substrate-binding protein [Deltaproteobacteria bacterium]